MHMPISNEHPTRTRQLRIALIGGAGFIGHHLALRLRQTHDVLIADSLAVNNKFSVAGNPLYAAMIDERLALLQRAGVHLHYVDARDYHLLSAIVGGYRPDMIVHLAAVAHIDRSNKDPFNTFDHNLRTLENALDIAKAISCKHFLFFSSSTAYGDFKSPVIDETERCEPKGIYGSLKYAGELLVKAYGDTYGLPWSVVRPCALYGPRCVSGRVTQKFVELAAMGQPIVIDGDGEGRHDFTYIEDLIDGVSLILERMVTRGEIFNITAGHARSLNELVKIINPVFPWMKVERGPIDPQKPSRGTMSNGKAEHLLGYIPKWTLERGMNAYMDWYLQFVKKQKAA